MIQVALAAPGRFIATGRNGLPQNFREIIALIKSGRIDTTPWITHRFPLAEPPQRFAEMAEHPGVIKTVIDV
jgi:threonine dehydrogenase-like Zn-dependent dehydrogenase